MRLSKRKCRYLSLLIVLTLVFLLFVWYELVFLHKPEQPSSTDSAKPTFEETKELPVIKRTLRKEEQVQVIETKMYSIISEDSAQYSVYVFFPSWSTPLVENDRQQSSASVIKIFILSTAYEMVEKGELDLDEKIRVRRKDMVGGAGVLNGRAGEPVLSIRELLRLMITESDNTATNILIDRLTFARIQDYCDTHGFTDTVLRRKMMDDKALRAGRDNLTTVKDVGEWMRRLKARELVSSSADAAMEQMLFAQTDTECFPRALPQAGIAHKTGELAGLYHDAGIIYDGNRGYVLVIFSSKSANRGKTLQTMRRMTEVVNNAFLSDD